MSEERRSPYRIRPSRLRRKTAGTLQTQGVRQTQHGGDGVSDGKAKRPRHVLARAAAKPANLLVAGASFLAAPLFGCWFLMLGMLLYTSLVIWKAGSPTFWREVLATQQVGAAGLPEPWQVDDPALRILVAAVTSGRRDVIKVLSQVPPEVRSHVRFAVGSLEQLESCAARLVNRAEELKRYLASVERQGIVDESRRLEDLVRRTLDPDAQREYRDAKRVRDLQLEALDEVARAYDRMTARLTRVAATIEGLPARIVRIRLLDAESRDDLSTELDEELDRVGAELSTCEQTLTTLCAQSDESLRLQYGVHCQLAGG